MLLEFRVTNFRSIKDEAVLNLSASKDKTFIDSNTLNTDIKSIPKLLSCTALYGANASGKSNLIYALDFFKSAVIQSATQPPSKQINVSPFKLAAECISSPSEFEITFIKNKVRYQYGFNVTKERVVEEWLYVYKTSKPQHWFTRTFNSTTQDYDYYFGPNITGQKDLWKRSTRHNVLFLSAAVQFNSEQLKEVYDFFENDMVIYNSYSVPNDEFTLIALSDDKSKKIVKDFLRNSDLSIENVTIVKKKGRSQKIQFNETGAPEITSEETEFALPVFHKKNDHMEATFELSEESMGTQRLFSLAGPLLDIFESGKVLIYDELDTSLHTLMAKRIIKLFYSKTVNNNSAQLIFTTHDTSLLDKKLFRRDQIWFIEKNDQHASELYPLLDFSPRKGEDLETGYLIGRYGAIPFFQE
ncbi:AAA family ATPase [Aliamphritea hakodatensis]|uniref:AAA family ATPase n=1 Tax=Aliamphritea hakodatensis TaxID=2895352 RepID=UPI0022FD70DB|nr:ATP-binding protein [Aliamphritea hakodatensis]